MALTPGTKVGSYEIAGQIGAGGMGEVYRATDTNLGRQVAIKVLPDTVAEDTERLARFDREARTLAALNHPNIAAIYGLERSEGQTALVMELVEGPTLADRVAAGPMSIDEAVAVALQITEALEAAHEQGIIHRDLKPANIKVRPDGTVKVLDFGLAKAMESTASASPVLSMSPTITSPAMTQAGIVLGTAAYMSPEQAKGYPADRRADIWAFGCVLYEMLAGRPVFEGGDAPTILARVLDREPDLSALPPKLHARLRELLERCLEKDPRNRWHDIADVRLEMRRFMAVAISSEVASQAPAGETRRSWSFVAVAAVVGLLIGAAIVWMAQPSPAPLVTRFPLDLAGELDPVGSFAMSPDGRTLVYSANDRLYRHALDRTGPVEIPGTEGGTDPFFSPDGQSVAYFTPTQLRRVDLDGSPPITLADVEQGLIGAWDERGNIIYGQAGPFGLSSVPETGGSPETFAELGDRADLDYPDALPGSEWVIYTAVPAGAVWNQAQIVARSVESGEEKVVVDGGHFARYVPTGHLIYGLEGTLFAVAFDPVRAETSGSPVPVVEDVFLQGIVAGNGHYAVAASGTLAFVSATLDERVLALVDRSGLVEPLDVPAQPYVHVRVSPDGSRLVAQTVNGAGEGQLWLYDLSGESDMRPLLQGTDARSPEWTPDGQQVAFNASIDGQPGIYVQPLGTGGPVLRAETGEQGSYSSVNFTWSPDASVLLFIQGDAGSDMTIWSASQESTVADRALSLGDSLSNGPVISPDGRWVAYWGALGRAARTASIRVRPFPAMEDEYAIREQDRFFPLWSRDGTELFYTTISGDIFSRSVSTSGTVAFGPERALPIRSYNALDSRSFDVMPDGERFLVVAPAKDVSPRVNVVLNWFEELRNRVGAN